MPPDPTAALLGRSRSAEPWWAARSYAAHAQKPTDLPGVPDADVATGDLAGFGVCDCLAAFRAGGLKPSQVIGSVLSRIQALDDNQTYVWSVIPDGAEQADANWASGSPRPLEGIPFLAKGIVDVAGQVVTCGSHTTGTRIATQDAAVVQRLRAAGAIPVGIAATTEFAAGSPFNPRHGIATNPWDSTRWTGGSSTGSGGALAARLIPLALGTDTGGSIRIPSAWCGVTGIKPTNGLVPLDGVATLSWTLDHIGPMARSAGDLVAALGAMAGPEAGDLRGLSAPITPASLTSATGAAASPRRIGVPRGWFDEHCDSAVLAAWDAALTVMDATGAELVPFDCSTWLGDLNAAHNAGWDVLLTELAATQKHNVAERETQDLGLQQRIAQGEVISGVRYVEGLSMRSVMLQRFTAMMDELRLDILLTPGVGAEAGHLGKACVDVDGQSYPFQEILPRNTMIFDLTGMPALMLPAGLGAHGLPVAIQMVGRPFADGAVLAAGMAFQAATEFHLMAPKGFELT